MTEVQSWFHWARSEWNVDWRAAVAFTAAFSTAFIISARALRALERFRKPGSSQENGHRAPQVPYWLPLFGNAPAFWVIGTEAFLRRAKETFPHGLFTVKLGGSTKTYVYSRFLTRCLLEGPGSEERLDRVQAQVSLMQRGFGAPRRLASDLAKLWPDLQQALAEIDAKFGKKLEEEAVHTLQRQMPDFISFSTAVIDQHQWERAAGTFLLPDQDTVETGLIAIIHTYLTHLTTNHLLSPNLLEQIPELVPVLLTLPSELTNLLHKPLFTAPRALAVQRTLLSHVEPFLDALYASEEQQQQLTVFDDVASTDSVFVKILQSEFMRSAPASLQASILIYLLTLSAIPHLIVPWTLLELNTDVTETCSVHVPSLHDLVNKRVSVVQEKGIGAFRPPPSIIVPEEARISKVINQTLAETTLKYARGWEECTAKQDITIQPTNQTHDKLAEIAPEKWHLKQEDNITIAHWLAGDESADIADEGTEASKLVGHALKQCLSAYLTTVYTTFLLSFLKLYRIKPVQGAEWSLPTSSFTPGLALPDKDLRVLIQAREYGDAGKEKPIKMDEPET